MLCPFCEKVFDGDARFCPHCGQGLARPVSMQDGVGDETGDVRGAMSYTGEGRPAVGPRTALSRSRDVGGRLQPLAPSKPARAQDPVTVPGPVPSRPAAPETNLPHLHTPAPIDFDSDEHPELDLLEPTAYAQGAMADVEEIPGLIDSRLFGAFVPDRIETPRLDSLETREEDREVDVAPLDLLLPTALTDGPVLEGSAEAMPELIDPRLFGAFVPAEVKVDPMAEVVPTALAPPPVRLRRQAKPAQVGDRRICRGCGTLSQGNVCRECGGLLD